MYQSALDLFCVSIIILFCFWLSSCGLVPDMKNPTLNVSKGDRIDGGGTGTQGVGEGKLGLNFSDNNSKNFERSNVKTKDISNQINQVKIRLFFQLVVSIPT